MTKPSFSESGEIDIILDKILKIITEDPLHRSDNSRRQRLSFTKHSRLEFELHPFGSITKFAVITISDDGINLYDRMRSRRSTVPYADPNLFNKITKFINFVTPNRGTS